ncbi:MAG: Gfo/Idh/MocA family oxidoreductase [Bacteroidetes bacterium]|nr:Gfo/Idh/MocA family oxidoreductase [Bacteroidota bacterium]
MINIEKITIGIIGAGMVAEFHIEALLKIKEVELKWICDKSENRLKKILEKYKIEKGTTDYKRVLLDNNIDAIVICTPPFTHYDITMDAINYNKHVLIEKPFAINFEQAQNIYQKAKEKPNLVIIDCSARHSRLQPKFNYIKNIINSKCLGSVYHIHHNSVQRNSRPGIEYNPSGSWFYEKKYSGGGPLIDWGVYDLSFHFGIFDDIPTLKSLKCYMKNGLDKLTCNLKNFNVEEHSIVMMELSDNKSYYYERSSHANNETNNETRIYGTKGGLKFTYLTWDSSIVQRFYLDENGNSKKEEIKIDMKEHQDSFADFFSLDRHFINCIKGIEKPIQSLKIALKHLKIIDQCYESAKLVELN